MLFHELLKNLRMSRELGLREFAHSIPMDVGNYSKVERGILNLNRYGLLAVAVVAIHCLQLALDAMLYLHATPCLCLRQQSPQR
jgi:transcriptional regulator with XRE-family HTH domain